MWKKRHGNVKNKWDVLVWDLEREKWHYKRGDVTRKTGQCKRGDVTPETWQRGKQGRCTCGFFPMVIQAKKKKANLLCAEERLGVWVCNKRVTWETWQRGKQVRCACVRSRETCHYTRGDVTRKRWQWDIDMAMLQKRHGKEAWRYYSQSHLQLHFPKRFPQLSAKAGRSLLPSFSEKRSTNLVSVKRDLRALRFELWKELSKCHLHADTLYNRQVAQR